SRPMARSSSTTGCRPAPRPAAEAAVASVGVPAAAAAYALHDRAVTAFRGGRLPGAERLALQALDRLAGALGPRHPDVAGAAQTLATIQHARGRYDEAAATARHGAALLARRRAVHESVAELHVELLVLVAAAHRDAGRL